jgi:hypothetical protein
LDEFVRVTPLVWGELRSASIGIKAPTDSLEHTVTLPTNSDENHVATPIPDLVLACECVYLTSQVQPLVKTICSILCGSSGDAQQNTSADPVLLLSHELRFSVCMGPEGTPVVSSSDEVLDMFLEKCESAGLAWRLLTNNSPTATLAAGTLQLYALSQNRAFLGTLPSSI